MSPCPAGVVYRRMLLIASSRLGCSIQHIRFGALTYEQWGTRIYKNIRLYFYSWRWYLFGVEEQSQRVRTHEEVVRSRKIQWTTDFSPNSRTYIVYNSHVPRSNSSFSFVMVKPTSHFFVFYWLQFASMCCLFPIGYLPKPTYMDGRICHHSPSSTTSIGQGDIPVITLLILSSAGWSCQQHPLCSTPAGHINILHSNIDGKF